MNHSLLCGAAKRKITPLPDIMPDLRGLQDVTFSSVLDDIFVRVLAVRAGEDTALLISFDLDKVPCPQEFIDAITVSTGIQEENISLLSTHTHTAPVAGYRPNEGPNFIERKPEHVQKATHEYERFLKVELLKAVSDAIESLRPARLGRESGESFVGINRVQDYIESDGRGGVKIRCDLGQDPKAPVDNRVFVLKAEAMDGSTIAFFINYAVHNCVMIKNSVGKDGGTALSSDLGGNVSQYIEAEYPGSVALWTSGAAGDINPVLSNQVIYPDPATGAPAQYEIPAGDMTPVIMLKMLAARHYADVLKTIRQVRCDISECCISGKIAWSRTPGRVWIRHENGSSEYVTGKTAPEYEIRVHMLRIGELVMTGLSGELYSSIGHALLDALPGENIIINHEASLLAESGYIFDDATWERDRDNALPGHKSSMMLPGYVQDALKKIVVGLRAE